MSLNVDDDNMFNVEYLNLKKNKKNNNNSELKYMICVFGRKFFLL